MIPHQDKISANNAFWREMLDQMPATILIFRIDQEDQAQLFFVNAHIKTDLGFTSEEYVLGSESDGQVSKELNALIDKIADLSHKELDNEQGLITYLTSRDGEVLPFNFDFKIFQSKTSRINLISVSLIKQSEGDASTEKTPVEKSRSAVSLKPVFVAESPIMVAVLDKVDQVAHHDSHVIIHGEAFTGKRTLLERLLNTLRMTGSGYKLLHADVSKEKAENALPELFSGRADVQIHALSQFREDLIIAVSEITHLSKDQLARVFDLLDYRARIGLKTRVFLTSGSSLESLVDQGRIPADALYRHLFISVPIPPLRHRKEDISKVAKKWSAKLCTVLELPQVEYTDAQLFQLEEQSWPENFKSLYEHLRLAVMGSKQGRPDIRVQTEITKKKEKMSVPEFDVKPDSVMSFNDMSRKYLQHVLKITNGKVYGDDGAANLLGLKPTTLQSKLKKLKVR